MTSDYGISGEHGDQLGLLPNMPKAGECYRDMRSGQICVVTRVTTGRRPRIWVRRAGEEVDMAVHWFESVMRRCRPDGRLM